MIHVIGGPIGRGQAISLSTAIVGEFETSLVLVAAAVAAADGGAKVLFIYSSKYFCY